jgi:hypothetical protein
MHFLFFETEYPHTAQTDFKLAILLPQPPKCWDYRLTPPHPALNAFLIYDIFNF